MANGPLDVTTDTPPTKCPECGHKIDAATGPVVPKAGDVSICIYCSAINVFNADRTIRPATDEEMREFAGDPRIKAYLAAVAESRRRHPDAAG